jgi:hypothetical protein
VPRGRARVNPTQVPAANTADEVLNRSPRRLYLRGLRGRPPGSRDYPASQMVILRLAPGHVPAACPITWNTESLAAAQGGPEERLATGVLDSIAQLGLPQGESQGCRPPAISR